MFVEFLEPSPKAGLKEHVSRETAAALIAAGFAKAVPISDSDRVPDKDDVIPPLHARGWEAGWFQWGDERKPVIIFWDGGSGKTVYDGPPPAQRRWTGEKYEFVSSDCPTEVIVQFHTLAGNQKEAAKAREEAEREALRNAQEASERSKRGNLAAIARLTYGK